jgi:uncharacterized membrane protein
VIVSSLVIVTGIVISFVRGPGYSASHDALSNLVSTSAQFPHTIADVVSGIVAGNGPAIVMAGMLLLIATPVVRVLVSIFTFVYQGDRLFVGITIFVFLMLILSFVLGNVEG